MEDGRQDGRWHVRLHRGRDCPLSELSYLFLAALYLSSLQPIRIPFVFPSILHMESGPQLNLSVDASPARLLLILLHVSFSSPAFRTILIKKKKLDHLFDSEDAPGQQTSIFVILIAH